MQQKQRVDRRPRWCTIRNKLVHLLVTQTYAPPGIGQGVVGEWVDGARRCSEYLACQETCRWSKGLASTNLDPMREPT